ncbi:tape measure protein [Acinetobacter sp. Z1]|uniref:tape measure protein n=1 Tax=Acinetobacter sp. Z1 TaxID=2953738 RepID=UPI0020C9720B|nr:tape measure protein [Acinetobacter sp. Z1]UTO20611.1 tape measure protein [Acinetobacter sp. Z1]
MATNSLDFLLNLKANTTGFDQGINGAKFAVNALVGAMATLGVGLGVKELAEAADRYANLSARIQLATKDTGDFKSAIAGVHQIALNTNSSLDSTAELFGKLNTVAKDMGMTQQQALDLTKTVTQAIKLGGGSVQGSEAAVQQFIQAMQGGVLRGEEFNSMMENGYGLAEALARGLGVTTGELRKMAENGELGAERVLKALEGQKAAIEASYAELPNTIGNALQKITTSWQIVIGEMDQANGASAQVAEWLSVLADNLDIVEVLLNDIGDGFVWFGDQLKKIDPATIEALKTALLSAYDAIKSLGSTVGRVFESTVDVLNTALGQIFNFSSGIDSAAGKTNGFTKALQAVNVVLGFLNDGFKAINIGINLIIGAAYDAAGAFSYWKSKITFGDTSEQALKDFELMSAKAQEYYKKSSDGAMAFKSSGVEAIRQIGLTQEEKNAESLANNETTLAELSAQEAKHNADYKALSDEKIRLNQQLNDAKKVSDQAAIDAAMSGLNELQKREQAYQSESEKLTEAKILAAQAVANATIKSADAAGQAALKALNAQLAAQGLKAEFDSAGKVIVSSMEVAVKETEELGTTADQSTTKVRKAASALEIDLDAALNRVSNKFKETERSVNDLAVELENTGVTGKEASEVLYLGWSKWLATAKSQAEIDIAKAKLQEFQEQGVFSTKQVEMGMLAIKQATAKLPDDLDEVGKAFERLGVKTKEQLKLAADSAIADFNTMKASGQATSEGLKQAYERVMQAAAASGNQAVIANAKAQGASVGLQAQIDETGKSSVQSTQEIVDSLYKVGETARGSTADGFRELGRVAREEAKTTAQEWEDAMAKVKAERDAQNQANGKGLAELQGGIDQMAEDYFKRLVSAGMDQSRAKDLADKARYSLALETTRSLKGGTTENLNTTKQEMEKTLNYWENQKGKSTVSTGNYQPIQVPTIQAPTIEPIKMPNNIDAGNPKNVRIELVNGDSSTYVYADEDEADFTEKFFRELEQAKKRS